MEDRCPGMGVEASERDPDHAVPLSLLQETFPEDVLGIAIPQGDATAIVRPEALRRIMEFLRDDPRTQFNILVDVTAVDYLGRKPRFDVVYHLLSLQMRRRMRIKVRVE